MGLRHGGGVCCMLMWFVAIQPYYSHIDKYMRQEFFVSAGSDLAIKLLII